MLTAQNRHFSYDSILLSMQKPRGRETSAVDVIIVLIIIVYYFTRSTFFMRSVLQREHA